MNAANDVREALEALEQAERFCMATKRKPGQPPAARVIADLATALRRMVEVRQHGTPADDVREALVKMLFEDDALYPLDADGDYRFDVQAGVDAILAAFEVRPHGTVTDADALKALATFYELGGDPESHGWTEDTVRRMRDLLREVRS